MSGEKKARAREGTGAGQEALREGGVILGQLAVSQREALRKRQGKGAGKAEAVD